ncbi:MAG: hypothetical protein ACLGI2_13180 [Acidimicrobiia bacterium]
MTRRRRTSGADGLITLRLIYLSFVVALVAIGAVVVILEANAALGTTVEEGPVAAAVVAVGVGSVLAGLLVRRPLPCGSASELAGGYRVRFFLRIAFAEVAALAGFVGFVLTAAGWLYPLGAAFAAIGFTRLAPTARHLQRDQEELRAGGCPEPLVPALRGATTRR